MTHSNSRLALDLEAIERQLRQARPAPASAKNDPLAELARIVGQDDPFRAVLSGEPVRGGARPQAIDDLFDAPAFQAKPAGSQPAPRDPYERALWDAAGREAPQPRHPQDEIDHAAMAYPSEDSDYPATVQDLRTIERSRSRKGLVTVCAVLGLGIAGVGCALMLRGGSNLTAGGEPPLIQAEREPLKVRPENPGGVDIPDQNKQIYERGAQDGQTKVVNREEQPIDVQQAARALPAKPAPTAQATSAAIVPPTGTAALTPSPAVTAALGEPRRVRTVTVRPDGSFVAPVQAPSAAPQPPAADATRPRAEARTPSSTPQAAATPTRPAPAPLAQEPAPQLTPTPAPPLALPQRPAPQRTASIAPSTVAVDAVPEITSAAGNFSVQLAVGFTEPEAQKLAQNLRQRFAGDLGNRPPSIRRAEVNGKTLYRVRIESLSREGASSLCDRVRSSGGQCFVAKN
jgi:hypothetical protein